jgi:hypothetical protein
MASFTRLLQTHGMMKLTFVPLRRLMHSTVKKALSRRE